MHQGSFQGRKGRKKNMALSIYANFEEIRKGYREPGRPIRSSLEAVDFEKLSLENKKRNQYAVISFAKQIF